MVVPTTNLVKGMTAIMRMRNGNDRVRFTTTSSTPYRTGQGRMPPLRQITSSTPMIMPNTYEKKVETSVMYRVSTTPSSSIITVC